MKKAIFSFNNVFSEYRIEFTGCKIKVVNDAYINGGYIGTLLETDQKKGLLVEHDCGSNAYEHSKDCLLLLETHLAN